jgi:hypothetical protein
LRFSTSLHVGEQKRRRRPRRVTAAENVVPHTVQMASYWRSVFGDVIASTDEKENGEKLGSSTPHRRSPATKDQSIQWALGRANTKPRPNIDILGK